MKKLVLILGVVLVASLFSAPLLCDKQALAISGCCKERASLNSDWRKQPGISINQCKRINKDKDGDNVFDASGLVWWDVNCR